MWGHSAQDVLEEYGLSDMNERGNTLWRCYVQVVIFHIVEAHLPCRVHMQFGNKQQIVSSY